MIPLTHAPPALIAVVKREGLGFVLVKQALISPLSCLCCLCPSSSKEESDEVKIDDGTRTCGSERRRRASASGAGEGAGKARGEARAAGAGKASAPRTTDSARCEGRADRCTGSG